MRYLLTKMLSSLFFAIPLLCFAQTDPVPRVVIKKATSATELPRPNTPKTVYLAVNDTLAVLGCYDGYYYVQKGNSFGFVYNPYVSFLGDSGKVSYMELDKWQVFYDEDIPNKKELKKVREGYAIDRYKNGIPGRPPSAYFPVTSTPSNPTGSVGSYSSGGSSSNTQSSICGAPTKSGKSCQRLVRGGGRCWQHGG